MTVAIFLFKDTPKNVRRWTMEICTDNELNAPVGLLIKNSRGAAGAHFAPPVGANKCAHVSYQDESCS